MLVLNHSLLALQTLPMKQNRKRFREKENYRHDVPG